VAVIVTKLLGVVQPDVLFLGEKDAQQLAVVRRCVRDLDLPVEVAGVPTLREPDGLAMSSRNVYLTREERAVAPDLYRALLAGAAAARKPGAAAKDVVVAATSALLLPAAGLDPDTVDRALSHPRFQLDYLAVVDEDTFIPEGELGPRSRLIVAAHLGATRLIDTISVASAYPAKDATA
jgi:pantoate--beta-alanine ligase